MEIEMTKFRLRDCEFCGNPFFPTSSMSKFCTPKCRFLDVVRPFKSIEGCWNWPKSINNRRGYGQFMVRPTPNALIETAHRLSYKFLVGDIPDGLFVLHKCDNRRCFNPAHLWLGTQADNLQDMVKKRRHSAHVNPALHGQKIKDGWAKRKELIQKETQ